MIEFAAMATEFPRGESFIAAPNPVDSGVYSGLEPEDLWHHFARMNAIPRPSGHEEGVREYVRSVAESAGASFMVDAAGNAIVKMNARNAHSSAPTVAIQAHLDMVCESGPDVEHNFLVDPIRPIVGRDRVFAYGTTLGADNGIGVAACLTILSQSGLSHGPLELIFTVEEETGLQGASALDASPITSKLLINLDSEDPTQITIGSAGGIDLAMQVAYEAPAVDPDSVGFSLGVAGLQGGHSGLNIDRPHGNAIKVLAEVLEKLSTANARVDLCGLEGGSARNAIPRTAQALVAVPSSSADGFRALIAQIVTAMSADWADIEPALAVTCTQVEVPADAFRPIDRDRVVRLLSELPHGVLTMSETLSETVETSCNLARVNSELGRVNITMTARSLRAAGLDEVKDRVSPIVERVNGAVVVAGGYPCWTPQRDSPLLDTASRAYEEVYRRTPVIQVVHAGLECGVIVAKVPEMQAISIGPSIIGAHTPEEYVVPSSVPPTWALLTTILRTLANG